MHESGISRRKVLGGAVAGVAALSSAHISTAAPRADIKQWDMETDVLVAGSGGAGVAAAIDARNAGAEVLLVESLNRFGGSSSLSGGVIYCGGGTALQKALGFEDSVEDMYNYIVQSGRKHPHVDKVQVYCEQSIAHFDWLVENGVPYNKQFNPAKGLSFDESSLYFSGNEEAWPWRDKFPPIPRGHVPWEKGHQGGRKLMRTLIKSAQKKGVTMMKRVGGERLVVESDGRIAGMIVSIAGERKTIRARRGVVLSCGGFIHNRDMVKRYAPELYDAATPWANAGDMGVGIMMGAGVGGATIRMDQGFSIGPIYPPTTVIAGIVVNRSAQRFVSEDVYHAVMGHEITYNQAGVAYLITDEYSARPPQSDSLNVLGTANSIAELEAAVNFPAGALQATVNYYNEQAGKGRDPVFHKSKNYLQGLRKPPFRAYDISIDKAQYSSHTFGGLETNTHGQVLDLRGDTIAGLYAAGRTTSGLPTTPYIASGISLGDCTFFGRRAGQHAATQGGNA